MDDDGYQSPVFDLSDHESDNDEGATFYNPNKTSVPAHKKKRKMEYVDTTVDLEALALKALGQL